VKLLLKEGASVFGIDGGSADEVEEESDEEVESIVTTMKTPPLSRISLSKSASTVVVKPVR